MDSDYNYSLYTFSDGSELIVTIEDKYLLNGESYIRLNDLPCTYFSELANDVHYLDVEDSKLPIIGNILVSNYINLVEDHPDSVSDIVNDLWNDKRIFVNLNGKKYYLSDYNSIGDC